MPRTITKEYTVYDYKDLKSNDELSDEIYQKFWLENPDNINPWADENLESFKKFADTLNMEFDCALSYGEYPDRGCYIKLDTSYYENKSSNKNPISIYKLIKDYKGNGYHLCDALKTYTEKLVDEWHKDLTVNDFAEAIQNKMFELWFRDNQHYFSKESFLENVEANSYTFDQDGNLFKEKA